MKHLRIQYNAPVVLTFALLSLTTLLISDITGGRSDTLLFSVYRSSLSDPFTYLRAFLHVLGHSGWEHYSSNILLMLVLGPQLEEKYGSKNLLIAIVLTALITGLVQWLFFPGSGVRGASGIVFMMLLLASMGGMRSGYIPLTMLLVAVFYIGGEVRTALTTVDNVSQLSHVLGGVCGAGLGFYLGRR